MNRLGIVALMLGASVVASNAETFDWSGGYIGAQIGGRWVEQRHEGGAKYGIPDFAIKPSGVAIGGYAGMNWQLASIIIGGELAMSANQLTERTVWPHSENEMKAQALYSAGARLGYALNRTLPYITTGFAVARYRFINTGNDGFKTTNTTRRDGWFVGAGVDHAITDNLIGRVDYRFYDLGKKHYEYDIGTDTSRQQTLTMGIAYKF